MSRLFLIIKTMDRFKILEQIYKSISSVERAVADFSECAIYELDDGIVDWFDTRNIIRDNIQKQKVLLRHIRDESSEITDEQRTVMRSWNLD